MENVSEHFNSAQKTGNQKMFLLVFAPDSVCVCKSQKSSDKKKYMMIGLFYSVQLFYGGGEACRQRSFVHRVVSSSKR